MGHLPPAHTSVPPTTPLLLLCLPSGCPFSQKTPIHPSGPTQKCPALGPLAGAVTGTGDSISGARAGVPRWAWSLLKSALPCSILNSSSNADFFLTSSLSSPHTQNIMKLRASTPFRWNLNPSSSPDLFNRPGP